MGERDSGDPADDDSGHEFGQGDSGDDESGQGDSGDEGSGDEGSGHEGSGADRSEPGRGDFAHGPNALCLICGGFRKLSEPRAYVIQATSDTMAGMTMGEWRECPHCGGTGHRRGISAPA